MLTRFDQGGGVEPDQKHAEQARERDNLPALESDGALGAEPADLASAVGNRAFSDLASQGGGILPGGVVHPSVERTIARTRGGGQPVDGATVERVSSALGDPLTDVRVHTDTTADRLNHAVAARAFTTGTDIYFAQGEYRPGSSEGDRLLTHELSHVVQQRGAPESGPLTVSEPGDALEAAAEASARELGD
jgi:Domain of unknown function (DUF4157)